MNTHTKTYDKLKCLYNTQGQVDCDKGINEVQNNGDIKCNDTRCLTPNITTPESAKKLTTSKNEQLFLRFVDEKFTWK